MSAMPDMENLKQSDQPKFDFRALDSLGARITNLVTDSRAVMPGDTFLAYPGEKSDGREFISRAIAAGANAVLWDRQGFAWDSALRTPNLPVAELRGKAGVIADYVYGHPSQKLWLIGITGTNGKTSCSHWIAQAMTAVGKKTAIIGTLGIGFPGELELTPNTTPDAVLLQRKLADFFRLGANAVAMEVSSHGIVQERINGTTLRSPCSPIFRAIISIITAAWRHTLPPRRGYSIGPDSSMPFSISMTRLASAWHRELKTRESR